MDALAIIQLRAPQWAVDPRVNNFILYAKEITSCGKFKQHTQRAIALRVLHMMASEAMHNGTTGTGTNSGDGYAGQVTMEREGDLQKQFSSIQVNHGNMKFLDLTTTQYGQELIALSRSMGISGMTRQGDVTTELGVDQYLWDPFS